MDAARNNFTVRLGQKVEAKKTNDEVGGEDSSSDTGKSKRSVDAAVVKKASWHKQQAVVFHVNNVQKSGRLTAIRDDDCDIQHDSDKDHESTNVPFTDVRALRWWHRWTLPTTRFEIQANVRYVDAKGRAHDGVITKRHRDNSYDIRHVSDAETEAQHVAVSDMQSLSVWSQAIESLGRVALFNGAPLAVGASVEFQLEDSSKWRAGTICKVRQDGKYNIEYTDNDDDEEEGHDKKVAMKVPSIRVRRRQSSSWTRAMLMLASGSLTLQDGMRVEITCIKDEMEVFQRGEIVRTHADETKTIRYDDGKIEKHVLPSRLRPLTTTLCVGTLVEASMETTHAALKCTAPMQGTIAWVHRDLKRVVLAIPDEKHPDQESRYCPDVPVEALRLQGNRLDTTSLHGYSVWRNLNMLANLALDAVVYGWYLLGLGNEIALSVDVLERVGNGHNDAAMQAWYKSVAVDPAVVECLITHPFLKDKPTLAQTPPYLLLPEVMMAWYWLIVLVCLKALAFAYIFVRALRLLVHTGNSIVLRSIHLQRHVQDQLHQTHLWRCMFGELVVSSATLLCFGSLSTTLGYHCLVDRRPLDLTNNTFRFSSVDSRIPSGYSYVGLLLAQVTATTTFNLYRGLCFLLVLVASSNFAVRAVMMIPSIAMTAFAWALALTSMQMFVSVQHDVLWRAGYFGLTLLHDMALGCIAAATWLTFVLFQVFRTVGDYNRLVGAYHLRGAADQVAVKQAEEGMLGGHAQEEALQIRTEEAQIQVGVVQAIYATLVPGIGLFATVVAVLWLLVAVPMLHSESHIDIPNWMVSTTVNLACIWLVALARATFMSCCKERTSWKLLRQGQAQQARPPVLLP
ncbi:hypothetical protein H310_04723 [Aphanomyces invadans]|uniref:Uncharacterized protein n=1 Tax=Aphanomyces invadans TaxID=157072 RepID=A0A024UDX4_9STRA|nr:hypothetical protein H310_04723 [Aphanomyces invadans]ETW04449.1 hypothetical protein H310_04723 [Aphanomyces invadans]|eukprot:XP_008867405.1 hypothetical protein H310_04723 [Aphanomyces invadans]